MEVAVRGTEVVAWVTAEAAVVEAEVLLTGPNLEEAVEVEAKVPNMEVVLAAAAAAATHGVDLILGSNRLNKGLSKIKAGGTCGIKEMAGPWAAAAVAAAAVTTTILGETNVDHPTKVTILAAIGTAAATLALEIIKDIQEARTGEASVNSMFSIPIVLK